MVGQSWLPDVFRYEHVSEPLLPRGMFIMRLLRHGGASVLLLLVSLAVGVAGYAFLDQLSVD